MSRDKAMFRSWDRAEFRKWKTHLSIIILILLTRFLGGAWVLQYPGVVLMQALDEQRRPTPSTKIVLVKITPEEYQTEFKNTSPLEECKLSELIDKLLSFKPAVLAIDLETADERFRGFGSKYRS